MSEEREEINRRVNGVNTGLSGHPGIESLGDLRALDFHRRVLHDQPGQVGNSRRAGYDQQKASRKRLMAKLLGFLAAVDSLNNSQLNSTIYVGKSTTVMK